MLNTSWFEVPVFYVLVLLADSRGGRFDWEIVLFIETAEVLESSRLYIVLIGTYTSPSLPFETFSLNDLVYSF